MMNDSNNKFLPNRAEKTITTVYHIEIQKIIACRKATWNDIKFFKIEDRVQCDTCFKYPRRGKTQRVIPSSQQAAGDREHRKQVEHCQIHALRGSTEEVKKQAEQRINSRFIMYVLGVHTSALKNIPRGRRCGHSSESQKLKRAGDYLDSVKTHSCGTIVERYLQDENYQLRMYDPGYTQSDVDEFDRITKERWIYVASSGERAYCRGQNKVVQPYQGNQRHRKDRRTP